MMNRYIIISFLIGIMSLSGCTGTINTSETIETPSKLVFIAEDWPPFEYVEDDEVRGIDKELIDKIMTRLGIDYEIKIYPWTTAWNLIQVGEADMVLSLSYKEDREEFVYYTEEQIKASQNNQAPDDILWMSEYVFFVRSGSYNSYQFESYEDIKQNNYEVGVIRGNTYFDGFWDADLDIIEYNDAKTCFNALLKGEIDLYIIDKTIGLATLKQLGESDKAKFKPFIAFKKPYYVVPVKNSKYPNLNEISKKIYKELADMKESGEYYRIQDEYTKD